MTTKRSPYPLQWPSGWKRASWRGVPKFKPGSFAVVRDSIFRQLLKMDTTHVVITSDLPTMENGQPIASGRCEDPGIAVYWIKNNHEHVIACDHWRSIGLNLRAIELTIKAMRGIDRWGSATMVDKVFSGFSAALPPGGTPKEPSSSPEPKKPRHWRKVFNISSAFERSLPPDELLGYVKFKHRDLIKTAHPDAGGSTEHAAELNAALDEATKDLSR